MIINTGLPLAGGVRFSSGSYVGTGTYGEANPCSLTFDFAPKIVVVFQTPTSGSTGTIQVMSGEYPFFIQNMDLLTTEFVPGRGFGSGSRSALPRGKKSSDGKTVSWFSPTGQGNQLNTEGNTYSWFALG